MARSWSIAQAESLRPAVSTFLTDAYNKTEALGANLSLMEYPSKLFASFESAGVNDNEFGFLRYLLPAYEQKLRQAGEPLLVRNPHQQSEWKTAENKAKELREAIPNWSAVCFIPHITTRRQRGRFHGVTTIPYGEAQGPAQLMDGIERYTQLIAKMLANASRYERERRNHWHEKLFLRIPRQIANVQLSLPDLKNRGVADLVAHHARGFSYAEVAALWVHDEPLQELHLAAFDSCVPGLPGEEARQNRARKTKEGLRWHVWSTQKPIYCPDTSKAVFCPESQNELWWSGCLKGIRSCYTVPLLAQGKCFAVLCIDSYRTDAFDPVLRKAIDQLAEYYGVLLNKAYREAGERVSEGIYSTQLNEVVSRGELHRNAVRMATRLVGARGASLFLRQGEPERLVFKLTETTGVVPQPPSELADSYQPGEGITGWVAKTGVPLRITDCGDAAELKRWSPELFWCGKTKEIASLERFDRPLLAVPIHARDGECIGVLRTSGKVEEVDEFHEEDKIALRQFAHELARELAFLGSIEQLSALPLRDYCPRLLRRCLDVCGADAGTMELLVGDRLHRIASIGNALIDSTPQDERPLNDLAVTAMCARSKHKQDVGNVTQPPWKDHYRACFEGIRSELAVPVLVRDEVRAVINLESTRVEFFGHEQVVRAEQFARLLSNRLSEEFRAQVPEDVLAELRKPGQLELALERYRADLPKLLETSSGKWVAYDGAKQVGTAASKRELWNQCQESELDPRKLLIRRVEPELMSSVLGFGPTEFKPVTNG